MCVTLPLAYGDNFNVSSTVRVQGVACRELLWAISSFSLPEWKWIVLRGKRKAEYLHDWNVFHPLLGSPPVDIFMLNQVLKKSNRELGADNCCRRFFFFFFWWWWWWWFSIFLFCYNEMSHLGSEGTGVKTSSLMSGSVIRHEADKRSVHLRVLWVFTMW